MYSHTLNRVGRFIADKASNNDTALYEIARETDIKPFQQRLRCNTRIIDLVAKAILYSTDTDCVADAATVAAQLESDTLENNLTAFEQTLRSDSDTVHLAAWREKGAIGGAATSSTTAKAHRGNVVISIRGSGN